MHWIGGIGTPEIEDILDVEVAPPYAFAVSPTGFHVIDVSNPALPQVVGFVSQSNLVCVTMEGPYAYVGGSDFFIIDVSDPVNPRRAGQSGHGCRDIAIDGSNAFVVANSSFAILDISDPENPQIVAGEGTESGCESIAVSGDAVYIGRSRWIDVFDVSNTENPLFVRSVNTGEANKQVRVHDDVLYASGYFHFTTLDITNHLSPLVLDSLWVSSTLVRFAIQGPTAFLAAANIRNIDISDPTDLYEISRYGTGLATSLAVSGEYLYTGVGSGFYIVDIADLNVAEAVGELMFAGPAYDVAADGEVAALATYTGGLEVVDLATPESPVSWANEPTMGYAWGVELVGETAFVADGPAGLSIYDLSPPTDPELVGSLVLSGQALDVRVKDEIAFMAAGTAGLVMIDVSDPYAPAELGAMDVPGSANRVEIWANWAFVCGGGAGLHVVNVSDPASPVLEATVAGVISDASVSAPYVYLVDQTAGLRVVDISNPADPTEISTLFLPKVNTPWAPNSLEVDGTRIYIAADVTGLFVVDGTDLSSPRVLGNLDTVAAREVKPHGDYVLIADEEGGLKVAPAQCVSAGIPSTIAWSDGTSIRILPNPVGAASQVHLRVARPGLHSVELFSVSGRRVARLFHGELAVGDHRLDWSEVSGPSLASGKYYVSMRRNDTRVGRAAIVVR